MPRSTFHKHRVSTYSQGADRLKFGPDWWREEHVYAGGSTGQYLQRDSAATDGVRWMTGYRTQWARGLEIRTSPDADAAKKVLLWHADEIVFDDGTRIGPVDRYSAALDVAGAGGLDTGSEAASTWYSAHLLQKSLDNSLTLVLHRVKDYFLDETYTAVDDGEYILRRATGNANTRLGQEFQVDTAGLLEFADLKLVRAGALAASRVWLTIHTDSSGLPSTTVLATSDKLQASIIPTTSGYIRFVFRTPATLSASTSYHLVLNGDYTASDTVNVRWRADVTASAYRTTAISAEWANNGTWTAVTADDFLFKLYVTRNNAAVTLPSGYDRQCGPLAYAYNGGGGGLNDLLAFVGGWRWHRLLTEQSLGSITATIPTLTDLSTVVPPGMLAVTLSGKNSTSGSRMVAGGLSSGLGHGIAADTTDRGATQIVAADSSNVVRGSLGAILTEFQGAYLLVNANTGIAYVTSFEW